MRLDRKTDGDRPLKMGDRRHGVAILLDADAIGVPRWAASGNSATTLGAMPLWFMSAQPEKLYTIGYSQSPNWAM